MNTLKTPQELAKRYVSLCDTIHDGEAYKEMEKSITQDRQAVADVLCGLLDERIDLEDEDTPMSFSRAEGIREAQQIIRDTLSNKV